MEILDNSNVESFALPGIEHRTVGGHKQNLKSMEVWMQTIAPGAATPVHKHPCEEVIVILSGSGECIVGDETMAFGPNSTLVIEPDLVHQLVNSSDENLELVATLGMAPVRVYTPEDELIPILWQAP